VNGNTDTTARRQAEAIARFAWFATFVVPLVLAALLLGVKSAAAAAPIPGLTPLAFEDEFEGEEENEGEFEVEACESAEEELEEDELSERPVEVACDELEDEGGKRAGGSKSVAPQECVLRSAHAHAVVVDESNKLKLTLGYTTYEPVGAKIEVSHVASLQRHLGRSGVLRVVKRLREHQHLNRVVVRIRIPSAKSAGCPSRRLVLVPR
jgi:hypothetical protein